MLLSFGPEAIGCGRVQNRPIKVSSGVMLGSEIGGCIKPQELWREPSSMFVEMRPKFATYRETILPNSLRANTDLPMTRTMLSSGVMTIDQLVGGGVSVPSVNAVIGPYGFDSSYILTLLVEGQIAAGNVQHPSQCIIVDSRNDRAGLQTRLMKGLSQKASETSRFCEHQNSLTLETIINERILYTSNFGDDFSSFQNSIAEIVGQSPISAIFINNINSVVKSNLAIWDTFSAVLGCPAYVTYLIQAFLEIVCRNLALIYGCPVWVVHEQKKFATPKQPAGLYNVRAVSNCRPFLDYVDTCLMLGTETAGTGLYSITCCKSPYFHDASGSCKNGARIIAYNDPDAATIRTPVDATIDVKTKSWIPRPHESETYFDTTESRPKKGFSDEKFDAILDLVIQDELNDDLDFPDVEIVDPIDAIVDQLDINFPSKQPLKKRAK